MAAVPQRLGSFEIVQTLGEGGSAFVYAAMDGDREVALKVLRPDVGLDAREVDRFLAEAETMRRVQHRALVPVLRAGLLPGGRPYIAMPRLHGATLAERLEHGPIPLEQALTLFEDVAQAVALLHDSGLVHRDIKPENVFWLKEQDRLVLLDLGIARDTSGLPSTTTRAGMMRGTPAYMAPERFFGKSATIRSDIYELAVLLYAMLTAQLPWDDGDAKGRIDPKPPSERGVAVPPALARVLLDTLAFDAERRPASVIALLSKIREATRIAHAKTELTPARPQPARPQPDLAQTPPVIGAGGTLASQYASPGAPYTPPGAVPYAVAGSNPPPPPAHYGNSSPPYPQGPPRFQSAPPPAYPASMQPYVAASSGPHPMGHETPGVRAVALPSTPPPARSGSNVGLVAVGAIIALAGVAGGAIVVATLLKRSDATSTTRKSTPDAEKTDATSTSTAMSTATASSPIVAPSPSSAAPSSSSEAPNATSAPSAPSAGGPSATTPSTAGPSPSAPSAKGSAAPSPSTTSVPAASPGPSGAMPAPCAQLIALMCSPTSGARPEECTAWKDNVASWRAKYSEAQTTEMCSQTYSVSKKGLEMRKSSKPP